MPKKVSFMANPHLVFFISKGQVGFVIPRFVTKIYRVIAQGKYFGHLELCDHPQLFEEAAGNLTTQNTSNPVINTRRGTIATGLISGGNQKVKITRRFTL